MEYNDFEKPQMIKYCILHEFKVIIIIQPEILIIKDSLTTESAGELIYRTKD